MATTGPSSSPRKAGPVAPPRKAGPVAPSLTGAPLPARKIGPATPGSNDDFIVKYTEAARTAEKLTGIPATLILGQWALESANGTSYGAVNRNNFAGIGGRGSYTSYASPQEFALAWADLVNRKYPEVAKAARTDGVEEAARAFGRSKWAAHGYRVGASGDEYKGGSGTPGTEGESLIAKMRSMGLI